MERLWNRVERARRWRERAETVRAVLRHKATHLAATFLTGAAAGAAVYAALHPATHPAPFVFIQPTSEEATPAGGASPAAPGLPAAAPIHHASSASTVSSAISREEQRLFDAAQQAFDRDDLDLALTKLAAHERSFPAGHLVRERQFLRARIVELLDASKPTPAPESVPVLTTSRSSEP